MTRHRTGRFVLCAWVLGSGALGCKTVDRSLLDVVDAAPRDGGADAAPRRDAEPPVPDAGRDAGMDAASCKAKTETCNGKDDDCDDKIDEGGDAWCAEHVILHAPAVCDRGGDTAACYWLGECAKGYASCDGDPANGCEADYCECNDCDDGGTDDGGS